MSLTPRLVAIEGIGYSPIQIAVQGLLEYFASGKHLHQDTDQGVAGKNKPEKDYLVENLNREYERKSRIQRDDVLATEFIVALLQMEMLDG